MAAVENTSGQGAQAAVPDEIKRWNWGAFLMNWIWAIAHNVWIGLLALIPYVGLVMAIVLGVKGSEWAWQNRRFESVEQFKTVQRTWAYWGVGLLIVAVIAVLAAIIFPVIVRLRATY
ncbi:MAG TPA: ribonuclease G [Armatimonadota bacterium]|nr:ribonuclease G [Armatimonadota bacterium]